MANHANAKKMIKVIKKRTEVNRMRKSRVRTAIKKFKKLVVTGDKELAILAFNSAQSNLHKCVSKGILHKNNAARKISRLNRKLKLVAQQNSN